MGTRSTYPIIAIYNSSITIKIYGHNNNVYKLKYYVVTKEIEEIIEMISHGLKDTTKLKFLPLDQIKLNMEHITVALE